MRSKVPLISITGIPCFTLSGFKVAGYRLNEHVDWIDDDYDQARIGFGSLNKFTNLEDRRNNVEGPQFFEEAVGNLLRDLKTEA